MLQTPKVLAIAAKPRYSHIRLLGSSAAVKFGSSAAVKFGSSAAVKFGSSAAVKFGFSAPGQQSNSATRLLSSSQIRLLGSSQFSPNTSQQLNITQSKYAVYKRMRCNVLLVWLLILCISKIPYPLTTRHRLFAFSLRVFF